jgi:hypothetical protein
MYIFTSGEGSDPVRDRGVGWVCFSGARQQFGVHFRRGLVFLGPMDDQSFRIFHRNIFWNNHGERTDRISNERSGFNSQLEYCLIYFSRILLRE